MGCNVSHDVERRLIGATVLISLAIIFLPMILEHKPLMVDRGEMSNIPKAPEEKFQSSLISAEVPEENAQPEAVIPTEPQQSKPVSTPPPRIADAQVIAEPTAEAKPEPVVTKPQAKPEVKPEAKPKPVVEKPAPVKSKPAKQQIQTKSGSSAWVIQVGSFSNQQNANKLVQRLRKAGLDTLDPQPAKVNGKQLYRVKVGPELDKRNAEKLLPKVKKVAGLQGTVIRYP